MSRASAPLAARIPWPVFTRQEAIAAGVHPERLRRSDLVRLRRGLYALAGHVVTELDIALALCRSDRRAVIVGLSAARLHGMPLPHPHDTRSRPVQVSLPDGRRGSDRVITWRKLAFPSDDIEHRRVEAPFPGGGTDPGRAAVLRLTSRARTWRDLAGSVELDRLVSIGDSLVRQPRPGLEAGRTAPWCTVDDLRAQGTGRYAPVLQRAADLVRVGADSPMETVLRLAFARAGLPAPQLNVPLVGADGTTLHTPDFQWAEYRVCAEYDGRVHNDPEQVARDIRRARRAAEGGWTEVRLHHGDLGPRCEGAVREVRAQLVRAGWSGAQRAAAC